MNAETQPAKSATPHASRFLPVFLRSAHRFFIKSESFRLPAGVIPPRRLRFRAVRFTLAFVFLPDGEYEVASASMARVRRSLSFFRSETSFARSTLVFLLALPSWAPRPPAMPFVRRAAETSPRIAPRSRRSNDGD